MDLPLFYGAWCLSITAKFRVRVPVKFRSKLGEDVVIYFNPDENKIRVYPGKTAIQFQQNEMRYLFHGKIDKQSRLQIPTMASRVFQGCSKVTWEGWGDYFEIIPQEKT
jgi:DNA-binding transcriptional regulator/RsmH inhibitor MraZ